MNEKELRVKRHLGILVVLVECLSLTLLIFSLSRNIFPDKTAIVLLCLLPIIFGLHVMEEFVLPGGFIAWDNTFRPQFTETAASFYVRVNAIPMLGGFLLVCAAAANPQRYLETVAPSWLTIATFMCWNAIFHLRGSIATRRYSPGVITGLALFYPLTIVSYVHFLREGMLPLLAVIAGAAALLIQPVLDIIKHGRAQAGA